MMELFLLLLRRADDGRHVDRAWALLRDMVPADSPSQLEAQVNDALERTR